jgi:hypothetical protein
MHIALRLSKRVDQSDAIVIKRNLSKRRNILQSLTKFHLHGILALGSTSNPIENGLSGMTATMSITNSITHSKQAAKKEVHGSESNV